MTKRDLSLDQYHYRMSKYGFTTDGFMGYWTLPGTTRHVSDLNAGDNRRDKIRYMLKMLRKEQARRDGEMT